MKPIDTLNPSEVTSIHEAALQVLESTGVKVEHAEARALLKTAGCEVNEDSQVVKLPARIVEDRRASMPSSFTVYGSDRKMNLEFGKGNLYFYTGSGVDVIDFDTNKRRPGLLKDICDATKVAQVMEHCHQLYPPVAWAYDEWIPQDYVAEYIWGDMFKLSTKSMQLLFFTEKKSEVPNLLKLAEIAAGGPDSFSKYPNVVGLVTPTPPLVWSDAAINALMHFVKAQVPVLIVPGAIAGGTGPATLAGILVQAIAEFLVGAVLVQIIHPGNPVIYGHYNTIMDMRFGTYASGAIESSMLAAASAQLARFYGIPNYGIYGTSDSHLQDQQVGYEKAMQWIMGAQAGVDVLHGLGNVNNNTLFALSQMAIDYDIGAMVRRALKGIDVEEERLAVQVIKDVGPLGNFLSEEHTGAFYREESFMPLVSERRGLEPWKAAGSPDIITRAKIHTQKLLDKYQCPVDKDVIEAIDAFLKSLK